MLKKYENIRPYRGQIVQGEVLAITDDAIMLDIGAKRDAIVYRKKMTDLSEATEAIIEDMSVGDQFPVYITNTLGHDGELTVSIEKGLEQQDWDRAETCRTSGEILVLKVTGYNKGGLLVNFGRLDGFIPNSLIHNLARDLSKDEMISIKARMIGKSVSAIVITVNQKRGRLVLSTRAAENTQRKQRLQELQIGEIITGIVVHVVDFGVFVDLGGVDGLIHISKLSWEKVDHPSEVLQPGDEVKVQIKDVDIDHGRISLDRRVLLPSPWEKFAQQIHRGDILEGKIESVRDFGVFVQLTSKIVGLIHVSELFSGSAHESMKALIPGEKVLVKVIEIDADQQRIGLSMRRVPEDDIAHWMMGSQEYSFIAFEQEEDAL